MLLPPNPYEAPGGQVGVADLLARSSIAFTSGFFRTLDETAIGDAFLHSGEAADIMDFVQPHEGTDLAIASRLDMW
jgi:hypothetical protein